MTRRLAAFAGIIGPLLFFGVVLAEGAARADYEPLRETISELSLGPRGWIQTANFCVFGVLFLVFARGVSANIERSAAARFGGSLLTVIGLGVLGCGLFRAEPWPPSSMGLPGQLHLFSAMVLIFASLPIATGVLALAFARDPHWRPLVPASVITSLATLVLLVGGLALMSPPGQPPSIGNEYAGLIQRIDVGVFLAWQVAVAGRLSQTKKNTIGKST